jgi:two-component system chemotaxis response regulator CheY
MQSDIQDVLLAGLCRTRDEGRVVKQMLMACGVTNNELREEVKSALDLVVAAQPDAALVVADKADERMAEFFAGLRSETFGGNRFTPIIVGLWSPAVSDIKTAIALGAHEILSLPANTDALTRAIYRAVFVGRPFIEAETYFGPCRRRKQIANYGCKDRRINAWDNYRHVSVKSA